VCFRLFTTSKLIPSENRDIHQTVPDHRVKLTPDGWKQVIHVGSETHNTPLTYPLKAEEAGIKLRSLLRPSDTLHFFTSPYRRTRETTEGILNALTTDNPEPSPFPRHTITVYEEPRLREQDFGNFQPDSAEMSRMWQERADYGHFFYRIPNGESAADAYDRVSGFNESLWRIFGEDNSASVCVLVTHGLMTRVFLMKWYHFSVEYFEDLRNVDHCEFVVMRLNESGKYDLQNHLRTWSELKRERANSRAGAEPSSPIPTRTRWAGCQKGDSGDDFVSRQRLRRQNTGDLFEDGGMEADEQTKAEPDVTKSSRAEGDNPMDEKNAPEDEDQGDNLQTESTNIQTPSSGPAKRVISPRQRDLIRVGRDGGGSRSGMATPNRSDSEDSDADAKQHMESLPVRSSLAMALSGELDGERKGKNRIRADALGDQSDPEDEEESSRVVGGGGKGPTSDAAKGLWMGADLRSSVVANVEDNV